MARPPFWFASNRMATRNPPPESLGETILAGVSLVLALVGAIVALILIDAASYPTEERCFQTSLTETNYCRSQADWGGK